MLPSLPHLLIIPPKRIRRQIPPILIQLRTLDDIPNLPSILIPPLLFQKAHSLFHRVDDRPLGYRKPKRINKVDEIILIMQLRDRLRVLDKRLAPPSGLRAHQVRDFCVLHLGSDTAHGKEEVDVVFDGEGDEGVGVGLVVLDGGGEEVEGVDGGGVLEGAVFTPTGKRYGQS